MRPLLPLLACVATAAWGDLVSRDIGDPRVNAWEAGEWVTCGGGILAIDERPDDPEAPRAAYALRLRVDFLPNAFGGWNAAPRELPLPVAVPSANRLVIRATGFPSPVAVTNRYVVCPPHRAFREGEKRDSIYGLNGHGGSFIGPARWGRLGFAWFRDYAYSFDWLKRARGAGDYGGWPWYPKLLRGAEDAGLMTLACLMGSARFPKDVAAGDPRLLPDGAWRRDLGHIVSTFGTIPAFELDNELDLRMTVPYEEYADGYAAYHRAFAEVVRACRPEAFIVSEGSAGLPVRRVEGLVKSGAYADVNVVNGHHYCGALPPELAVENVNAEGAAVGRAPLLDVWRNLRRAADADGRHRQVWLTEWGFDTLAGHVVSEEEQAAYLQREWLLGMQAGLDKMFWYWLYDTAGKPKSFFDGCGLYDGRRQPKPAAGAFATLRAYIPGRYRYVGFATPAPNALVHLVEADGRFVAAAFKVEEEGPEVVLDDPPAARVTDMFGRQLARGRRRLVLGPTWYLGLDRACDWMKAAPIDLAGDRRLVARAGESVAITPVPCADATYAVRAPAGWSVAAQAEDIRVTPPAGCAEDAYELWFVGRRAGVEKRIRLTVDVLPSGEAAVAPPPARVKDWTFRRVSADAVVLDGELSDWSDAHRLPAALFGLREGRGKAVLYAGWNEQGLYLAVDARDSRCVATDPDWFWDGADCIEIAVDTAFNQKGPRAYSDTDSHFWLCPLRRENRLYVGRWGHDGRPTVKDDGLRAVKSALTKTDRGYRAEVYIPASELTGWNGVAGRKIGFAMTLVLQGRYAVEELAWPIPRRQAPFTHPDRWSRVTLGESE